ncbi:MAG: two-component regulator propeller domain-containing protein, partial [Bacteroidia bacterium]
EGLSQSTVFSMAQDSAGFWWFGTQDGLNRYDGYAFEVFKHEPFDPASLSDNQVTALMCDRDGQLWVGTGSQGIDIYLPETNTFKSIAHIKTGLSNNIVNVICQGKAGDIWVGTAYGLNRLQKKASGYTISQYFLADTLKKTPQYIRTLYADSSGHLYIGTLYGLAEFDYESNSIKEIEIAPDEDAPPTRSENQGVTSIVECKLGYLWLGMNNGLYVWDRKINSWTQFWRKYKNRSEEFFISQLRCAPNGDLWASTLSEGVLMLPWLPEKGEYQDHWFHFSHRSGVRVHLSSDDVRTIMPDALNPHIVWLGHATAGVEKLVRRSAVFSTFNLREKGLEKLDTRFVSDIVTDTIGGTWIATNRGLVHQDKLEFSFYPPSTLPGGLGYVTGLVRGPQGRIWISSPYGMGELIPSKNGGMKIRPCFTNSTPRLINDLSCDREGYIYFALGKKVFVYNPKNDALSGPIQLPDSLSQTGSRYIVYDFLRDTQNRLWIATTHGLIMWPDIKDPMENLEQLPYRIFYHDARKRTSLRNNVVLCLEEDKDGYIWIGTGNGLHRLREVADDYYFEAFTEKNGLANNFIYGILEDEQTGELWLSTNNGLSRMDPKKGTFDNYDAGDGLQSNEFNSHAYHIDPETKEMFFGGINGFTRFFPGEIQRDTTPPKVRIMELRLAGGEKASWVGKKVDERVELDYKNHSFSVHFVGLNYTQPERNQYKYRLQGLRDSWTEIGPTRQVNFPNLPPGNYTFEVTASNSDGIWSPKGDSIEIEIKPPFHQTGWFYLLIALGIGLALLVAHRIRVREKVRRLLDMERVRKNAAADFHDELGHKLTVIALSGEIAKQKLADRPEALPQLNKIITNAHSLYYAMKDLLWVLDPTKDSVYDLALLLKDFGDELFDRTGIAFHTEGLNPASMQEAHLAMDQKRHVALMFKEVMNNTLKHAACSEASLSVFLKGDQLTVAFADNGSGFDAATLPSSGNGLLNMRTRAETIGAEFDIQSGAKGTKVSVQLEV